MLRTEFGFKQDPKQGRRTGPDLGSQRAIKAVLRIRDPGLGTFLTHGSGIRDGRK
jgi:hypothetical protein